MVFERLNRILERTNRNYLHFKCAGEGSGGSLKTNSTNPTTEGSGNSSLDVKDGVQSQANDMQIEEAVDFSEEREFSKSSPHHIITRELSPEEQMDADQRKSDSTSLRDRVLAAAPHPAVDVEMADMPKKSTIEQSEQAELDFFANLQRSQEEALLAEEELDETHYKGGKGGRKGKGKFHGYNSYKGGKRTGKGGKASSGKPSQQIYQSVVYDAAAAREEEKQRAAKQKTITEIRSKMAGLAAEIKKKGIDKGAMKQMVLGCLLSNRYFCCYKQIILCSKRIKMSHFSTKNRSKRWKKRQRNSRK